MIGGDIFRDSFRLKYPVKISTNVEVPDDYDLYVGDYFIFNEFDIFNPKLLLNCLIKSFALDIDSLLIKSVEREDNLSYQLIVPRNSTTDNLEYDEKLSLLSACPDVDEILNALKQQKLIIKFIDDSPIDFIATRKDILAKVHNGNVPKGILKKWPLYVMLPSSDKEI